MRRRLAPLVLALVALTAGCLGGSDPADGAPQALENATADGPAPTGTVLVPDQSPEAENGTVDAVQVDRLSANVEHELAVSVDDEVRNASGPFTAGLTQQDLAVELAPPLSDDATVTATVRSTDDTLLAEDTAQVEVAPPEDDGANEDPDPTPSATHVYRPGLDGEAPRPLADPTEVLPEDVPLPVGLQRSLGTDALEPTLGTLEDGTLFYAAAEDPQTPRVMRSTDDGATWTEVTPELPGDEPPDPVPAGDSIPPITFDPYVHVDEDAGRVFDVDLGPLTCSTISFSDDAGETWTTNPVGCGHPVGGQDHQTVFTGPPATDADEQALEALGYPNVVYYCVNRVADSACARSLDGGLSFGPLRPLVHQGPQTGDAFGPLCSAQTAHGVTGPNGTVYVPTSKCSNPGVPLHSPPVVAVSHDDGLTWDVRTIAPDVSVHGHEVAMAIDEVGNAYAFWVSDERDAYLATSTDGGETWSDPVTVAPPGVATTSHPTIAAGSEGRIAMAYIGTAADKPYSEMNASDAWNGYLTVATNATDEDPVLLTTPAHAPDDPIARGECGGERCTAPGSEGGAIYDFIDVTIAPDGRPLAALVDACDGLCAAPDGTEKTPGIAFVGTLEEGPRLSGELAALDAPAPADG
jgi:hypothetical protein